MNAEDILNALRRSYPTAAFVPELTINDEQSLADYYEQGEHEAFTRRIDALMFDKRIRTAIEIFFQNGEGGGFPGGAGVCVHLGVCLARGLCCASVSADTSERPGGQRVPGPSRRP